MHTYSMLLQTAANAKAGYLNIYGARDIGVLISVAAEIIFIITLYGNLSHFSVVVI